MEKIIDIVWWIPIYWEIDVKEYYKKKEQKEIKEIKKKEEQIKNNLEKTENILKDSNFLNNQNYINSRLVSSRVYSSYLKLSDFNKFYQIAIISNDIFKIIITFVVWYIIFVLPASIIIESIVNNKISPIILFILLFLFIYTVFFLIMSIFIKHIYNTGWIIKYKDKFSLFDIFFRTENKWFIDKWNIQLENRTEDEIKSFFKLKILVFLIIIVIVSNTHNIQYNIIIIYLASFMFMNINNMIYYILYKFFAKIKYLYNIIYYYFNPNYKKVYLLSPNNKKINIIFKVKYWKVYTDIAFIKDKLNINKNTNIFYKRKNFILSIICKLFSWISEIYDIIAFYIKPTKK